jgi:hypothetical protein
MFSTSRIVTSLAVILSAASVLSTHAFAENSRLDGNGYATRCQNGKGERAQMNRCHGGNAIRGEDPRQQDAPPSWIENPASPGG